MCRGTRRKRKEQRGNGQECDAERRHGNAPVFERKMRNVGSIGNSPKPVEVCHGGNWNSPRAESRPSGRGLVAVRPRIPAGSPGRMAAPLQGAGSFQEAGAAFTSASRIATRKGGAKCASEAVSFRRTCRQVTAKPSSHEPSAGNRGPDLAYRGQVRGEGR